MANDLVSNKELLPAPQTFDELYQQADLLAQSCFVPDSFKKGKSLKECTSNVMVAMMYSKSLGLPMVQGLQSIAVINGRPCLWGDAMKGLVLSSPQLVSYSEDFDDKSMVATCSISRKRGNTTINISKSFSYDDAVKTHLLNKGGAWAYVKDMLMHRAVSRACRSAFADVLSGLQSVEELSDGEKTQASEEKVMPQAEEEVKPKRTRKPKVAKAQDVEEVEAVSLPAPDIEEVRPLEEVSECDKIDCDSDLDSALLEIKKALSEINTIAELNPFFHSLPEEQQADQSVISLFGARKHEIAESLK